MPYNPGITYRGDQWLAEGIASLGRSAQRGVDRVRDDARETQALRQLAGIYDREGKDKYTSKGLGELRGIVQGFALEQALGDQQIRRDESKARLGNLEADNRRSDEFLQIQQDQAKRQKENDLLRAAAQRIMAEEIPVNPLLEMPEMNQLFPGIRERYRGPAARVQRAMREAPGGIPPEAMASFMRQAAEMADPTRQMRAEADATNAKANLTNANKPKGEMTEAQKAAAARGDRSLNLRERGQAERSLNAELKGITEALTFNPPNKAELEARAAALRAQLDELRSGGGETPSATNSPAAQKFSMDAFKAWEAGRK